MQDDSGALAGWYGGTQVYRDPEALSLRAERVQAVTAEEVQRVAQRVFAREGLVVTAVGPVKAKLWAECERIAAAGGSE
jgi:predicted Zn-dependent peptidase